VVWSNVDFLVQFLKRDPKTFGSSLSHIGFGLMLIGIIASGTNKRIISQNQFLMEGLTAEEELERTSITLFKDLAMGMENYELTFKGDSIHGFNRTYFVDYIERDTATGEITQQFTLEPNILYDRKFEKVAITNPSTKHYWNRDVFTVIMSMPAEEQSIKDKQAKEDSLRYVVAPLAIGDIHNFRDTVRFRSRPDTFLIRNFTASLESFAKVPDHPDYEPEPGDIGLSATVVVRRDARSEEEYRRKVALVLRDGLLYHYPAQINDIATRVKIDESVFDLLLVKDEELAYEEYTVKPGDTFTVGENTITFRDYQPNPEVPHYTPSAGDVSVAALLEATNRTGKAESLAPVFVIRNQTPNRIRDMASQLGLYANLININTENGEATIMVAQAPPSSELKIPIAIASNATRSDWITLQAIEFPGINLFWIGTLGMMLGMLINMVIRLRSKR
jgi:cytochrome c-type biogenesis protein CcmF